MLKRHHTFYPINSLIACFKRFPTWSSPRAVHGLRSHYARRHCCFYRDRSCLHSKSAIKFCSDAIWTNLSCQINLNGWINWYHVIILTNNKTLLDEDFMLHQQDGNQPNLGKSLKVSDVEKELILQVLAQSKGNLSKAAIELGMGRSTLYRKMERHGIDY